MATGGQEENIKRLQNYADELEKMCGLENRGPVFEDVDELQFRSNIYEVKSLTQREIPDYKIINTLSGHTSSIASMKFNYSGEFLASSSYDGHVKLWNGKDGAFVYDLAIHKKGISDIAWSNDGNRLVSASDDRTLKIWDVSKVTCISTLTGHSEAVFCTNFGPKGNYVLSGSDDHTAKLWDARTGSCEKNVQLHSERVTSVEFDCAGKYFLTSSLDGLCYISDNRMGKKQIKSLGDGVPISFAKFSRKEKYILLAKLNSTITLWNRRTLRSVKTYQGHQNVTYSIFSDFSCGGKFLLSGSEDKKVRIWHVNHAYTAGLLEGHTDPVLSVACHPQCSIIATGSLELKNNIKLWKSK